MLQFYRAIKLDARQFDDLGALIAQQKTYMQRELEDLNPNLTSEEEQALKKFFPDFFKEEKKLNKSALLGPQVFLKPLQI
jgi:hypothetical protein